MDTDSCVTLCTCPDAETASALAEQLVGERLAACVSVLPGLTSVYRWEGAVQRDSEVLLIVKTATDRVCVLTETLARLHPYEVPEIIVLPIAAGLPGYLAWIHECTRPTA